MTYEETTHCQQKRDLLRLSCQGRPPTSTAKQLCSQRPNSVLSVDFKSCDIVRVRFTYRMYMFLIYIPIVCNIHPTDSYQQNLQILDATEIAGWFIRLKHQQSEVPDPVLSARRVGVCLMFQPSLSSPEPCLLHLFQVIIVPL